MVPTAPQARAEKVFVSLRRAALMILQYYSGIIPHRHRYLSVRVSRVRACARLRLRTGVRVCAHNLQARAPGMYPAEPHPPLQRAAPSIQTRTSNLILHPHEFTSAPAEPREQQECGAAGGGGGRAASS
jgi:hypothetical protein